MSAVPVRSLGCRTDLMFVDWEGHVDDLGDSVRAYSPLSPDYFFGNFLLFPDPPGPGDAGRWTARFADAFSHDRRIRHVCLRWDSPDGAAGELGELEAAGFTIDRAVVLTADRVHPPPRPNREVRVHAVESEREWELVEILQVATSVGIFGPSCESWARRMVKSHRRMVEEGRGRWFAATAGSGSDSTLVADLGVFVEDGVGRFQAVETEQDHRRRGICGTLLHHAAEVAFADLGAGTLVITADPHQNAARIYRSVGFVPTERLVAAFRPPRAASAGASRPGAS
jgi:GNAT superfamily N-acetyltransferase